jgi:hypothetical protein
MELGPWILRIVNQPTINGFARLSAVVAKIAAVVLAAQDHADHTRMTSRGSERGRRDGGDRVGIVDIRLA